MLIFRACLHLIADENPRIKEEYNLIDSLKILDEFNTNILPLQVRLTKDKIKLIETCLQSWDTAYKNRQKLLNLGKYLHIHLNNGKLREGTIFQLIAQKALEVNLKMQLLRNSKREKNNFIKFSLLSRLRTTVHVLHRWRK